MNKQILDQQKKINEKDDEIDARQRQINEIRKKSDEKDENYEQLYAKYAQACEDYGEYKGKYEAIETKTNVLEESLTKAKDENENLFNQLKGKTETLAKTEETLEITKNQKQKLETKTQDQKETIDKLKNDNKELIFYKNAKYEKRERTITKCEDLTEENQFLWWEWTSTVGYKSKKLVIYERRLYLGEDEKGNSKWGKWEVYRKDKDTYERRD